MLAENTIGVYNMIIYRPKNEDLECLMGFEEYIYRIIKTLNEKAADILQEQIPEVFEEKNRSKCEYGIEYGTNKHTFWVCGMKIAEWSIEITERNVSLLGPVFFATKEYVHELLM